MLLKFFDEESQRNLHEGNIKKEGSLSTLASLVKKGLLSISDAACEADMSETEFANIPQMEGYQPSECSQHSNGKDFADYILSGQWEIDLHERALRKEGYQIGLTRI